MNDASVVVAKGKRKREIKLPFGLCGSRETLTAIRDSIDLWLSDPGNGHGISYGWCRIEQPQVKEWIYGPTNTQPEPWGREGRTLGLELAHAGGLDGPGVVVQAADAHTTLCSCAFTRHVVLVVSQSPPGSRAGGRG